MSGMPTLAFNLKASEVSMAAFTRASAVYKFVKSSLPQLLFSLALLIS